MSGLLEVRRLPPFIRRLILNDRERLSAFDETSDGAIFLPAVKRSSSVTCKLSSMPVRIIELGRMENARLMGGIAPSLVLPEPAPGDANPGETDPCRFVGVLSIISCRDVADKTLELREALLAACDILRFKLTRWISSLKFLRKTKMTKSMRWLESPSLFPKLKLNKRRLHLTKLLCSGRISLGTSLLCTSKHLSKIWTCISKKQKKKKRGVK